MATGRSPSSSDEQFTRGRFSGKVAIVTGGASGIGEATVRRFLNDGAAVAIFDINDKQGKELETSLKSSGHKVVFHCVDVSDRDQCIQEVDRVARDLGRVNYLCNNAAYFGSKGVDVSKEDWEKTMSVNVQGYSNMVQACLPYMKKEERGSCSVVNVASSTAHRASPKRWTYSSSKSAVLGLTRCMALDLSEFGIRVNSVSPAFTYTPFVAKLADNNRAKWEPTWGKIHILERLCEPSEVASAIVFLFSRDASFITGTDLPVDGGFLALSAEGIYGVGYDAAKLGVRAKWEPLWSKFHMLCRMGKPIGNSYSDASFLTFDLPVDGGYLGMSAEGLGENSKFAGTN